MALRIHSRWLLLFVILALINPCSSKSVEYEIARNELKEKEALEMTGGGIQLSFMEKMLSWHLQKVKKEEMKEMAMEDQFPPSMHFFNARPLIEESKVFQLLKTMPKGAALHLHSTALVSAEWLVKNLTYRPNCYICFTERNSALFKFSSNKPAKTKCASDWELVKVKREEEDTDSFDQSLIKQLSLITEDPESAYQSDKLVWEKFEDAFVAISGLISYEGVFKDHIFQGLTEFYEDNVIYLEVRSSIKKTYKLDGSQNDKAQSLNFIQEVIEDFQKSHTDFMGLRLIVASQRGKSADDIKAIVQDAIEMQKAFPDLIAGFDLIGREDTGNTLFYFKDVLTLPADEELPYFFHAGETNWQGGYVDANLLDALLLNTHRIGHGYALIRHPAVKEELRKKDVAVEVCPISNQVLRYVSDMRNHPAAVLMSEGYPVVISSDDPTLFGNTGLSYDFYETFVGIGGMSANLATLKQLAMNSIKYSSLPEEKKNELMEIWEKKWQAFVFESSKLIVMDIFHIFSSFVNV